MSLPSAGTPDQGPSAPPWIGAPAGGFYRRYRPGPLRLTAFEWPWLAVSIIVALAVLAPIGGLLWFAARGSGDLWPHLAANVIPVAFRTTIVLLFGVGLLVSLIGVGTAWLVATCQFRGRRQFEWALLLPLAIPTYIAAYAYLDVTHPVGPLQTWLRDLLGIASPRDLRLPDIRSIGGAIVLLGLVLYPYVYLPVRALFTMQSASALEAARTLGANRTRTFFRIALPLARPAIVVGLTLALLEALNDIGASAFLGIRTLTVSVYTTWVTRSSIEGAAQIALVMLAIVVALIVAERWARRRQRFAGHGGKSPPPARIPLSGLAEFGAIVACALPVLLGFAVPAIYLATAAWSRVAAFGLPPGLGRLIFNSVSFAAVATVIAVLLGVVLAYMARLVRHPVGPVLVRVASLGYAVPGTVLAVGLLVPLAAFDNTVDGLMRSFFGISTGLLLVGSGAALVIAYVIRFLTVSIGASEAGFAKISPSLDMAARSLGVGPAGTAVRIHLPILAPALAAGAMLVFVDCMKELPATLLLRPFNFETLATHIYGEASRGTYETGAVSALAIVLVGMVPVILLARTARLGAGPRG